MWAATCLASCCAGCACEACRTVVSGIGRRSARIAYCGLFALSLIVSWILREVAAPFMEKIPCKLQLEIHSTFSLTFIKLLLLLLKKKGIIVRFLTLSRTVYLIPCRL